MAFDIKYTIELINNFSTPSSKISKSLETLDQKIKTVDARLKAATDRFKKFGRAISTHLSLPLSVGAAAAIHAAATFEQSMTKIQATTHASGSAIDSLRQQALKFGAQGIIPARDIAKSEETMSRFHMSVGQIKNALGQEMKLAIANAKDGVVDLNSAAEIGVRIQRAFGKQISDFPKLFDAITTATHNSGGTLAQFYGALRYTDVAFSQAKVPFKDAIAFIGMMATKIDFKQMPRAMRGFMSELKRPTGDFKIWVKKLGLTFYDAKGHFLGIGNAIKQLSDNFKTVPDMGRNVTQLAQAVVQLGLPAWQKSIKAQKQTGLISELYNQQVKSLKGSLDKLSNSIKSLSISLVDSQKGPLQKMIDSMQNLVLKGLGLSTTTKAIIAGTVAFGAVLGPVLMSLGSFAAVMVYLGKNIGFVGDALAALELGFGALIGAISLPVTLMVVGFGLAATALYKLYSMFKVVRDAVHYLGMAFGSLMDNPIQSLISGLKMAGNTFEWLYDLVHSKPLSITQKLNTEYVSSGMGGMGSGIGSSSLSSLAPTGGQQVKSTVDVNVFDPHRYIKDIAGHTSGGDLNLNLGSNMAFSR